MSDWNEIQELQELVGEIGGILGMDNRRSSSETVKDIQLAYDAFWTRKRRGQINDPPMAEEMTELWSGEQHDVWVNSGAPRCRVCGKAVRWKTLVRSGDMIIHGPRVCKCVRQSGPAGDGIGVAAKAATDAVSPAGGRHSAIRTSMTQVPPRALIEVAATMKAGDVPDRPRGQWRKVPIADHLDHGQQHLLEFQAAHDALDQKQCFGAEEVMRAKLIEELAHAAARLLMALELQLTRPAFWTGDANGQ